MLTLKENETGPYIVLESVDKVCIDKSGIMWLYDYARAIPIIGIEPQEMIRNEELGVQFILQDLIIEAAEKQEVTIERE